MKPFEKFAAGSAAHDLAILIYQLSARWPKHEVFGLTSQTRRAAVSVCTNLSEGATRRGTREFRRFLDLARGSHGELQYLVHLAQELGYIDAHQGGLLAEKVGRTGAMLWGLYSAVAKKAAEDR